MKGLILVALSLICAGFAEIYSSGDIEEIFRKLIRSDLTDLETKSLGDIIDILYRPNHLSDEPWERTSNTRQSLDCVICRSIFSALFESVASGSTDDEITDAITSLCVSLNIEDYNVCHGAIKLNIPILSYIIKNTQAAQPRTFCSLLLQRSNDPNVCINEDPRFEWRVDLPERTRFQETFQHVHKSSENPFKIAIITDAHIDPLYEVNGVANCGEPTCCRKGQKAYKRYEYKTNLNESIFEDSIIIENGEISLDLLVAPQVRGLRNPRKRIIAKSDDAPAGYWGDYRNCDTPLWAFDEAIDTITETHKNIDLVYYVGDTIDHGVWETSYELINNMNNHVVEKFKNNFGNVTVLPVIGNHESQPTNQYAPSRVTGANLNTTWLYDSLALKWDSYLTEEAKLSMKHRGGFAMVVRPGLKVISINNNVAYRNNWWLVYDPTDAKTHLDWLVEELYRSELAGEKVHILAHIPPGGHDFFYTWTREYNRIVNRFSDTIAAEFNGHTHSDEIRVFYNSTDGNPINVAWGMGGLTPYNDYNYNYKIATFDTESYALLNIQNYIYNVTEANLTPQRRPHWFQLYDMKNTYELSDLSAASIHQLLINMVTEQKYLLELYAAFYSKLSDKRWSQCDQNCKLNNLCKTVVTVLWERDRCNLLVELYNR